MGRNTSTVVATSTDVIATVKTSNKLVAGDLVASGVTGAIEKVLPSDMYPQPTTGQMRFGVTVASTPSGTYSGDNYAYARKNDCFITFEDGTTVFCYTGNGSTASTGITYVGSFGSVVASSAVNVLSTGLLKLDEDKFLVFWVEGNTAFKFRIVSKLGEIILTTQSITIEDSASSLGAACNGLDRFVFTFKLAAVTKMVIYDYAGTEVAPAFTLTSTAASYVYSKFLSNGNIFCFYNNPSNYPSTRQLTKDGVFIGSELVLISDSTSSRINLTNMCRQIIAELDSNVYVLVTDNSVVQVKRISFTNTLVGTYDINISSCYVSAIQVVSGNLLISINQSANIHNITLNKHLSPLSYVTCQVPVPISQNETGNFLHVFYAASGFIVLFGGLSGSVFDARTIGFSTSGVQNASVLALPKSSDQNANANYVGVTDIGVVYINRQSNTSYKPTVTKIEGWAKSVLGVVVTDAQANTDAEILIEGSSLLNKPFSNIGSFDRRASEQIGNRGYVVGNTAVLFGPKV